MSIGLRKFLVPDIDYDFWENKNSYYSPSHLENSIQVGLVHACKGNGGLSEEHSSDLRSKCSSDVIEVIKARISYVNANNIDNICENDLLLIFDLIQAWGGKMCKTPYVRPGESPYRNSEIYPSIYREAIKSAFSDTDSSEVLRNFCKLEGVNISFATKHMSFWSQFNPEIEHSYLIYDRWIESVFKTLNNDLKPNYAEYLYAITEVSQAKNLNVYKIERGLFAFLTNHFTSIKMNVLRSEPAFNEDINVAKKLLR